ncbi:MAG: class I SAM-dependent DNA methyltransferase [Erythrobacter sp.]|nr:class I SAM-dependent DNA methyltransferase [Erythrobacter sp.]NCQ64807.1 class I SAM-dependent DNA methyltransferase [Alphaproteobacteria bacterium]
MNTIEIEKQLDLLVADVSAENCSLHEFPFRLMEAYEASRNEVNKLRMKHPEGLVDADILWPKKLLYRAAQKGEVQDTVTSLKASLVGKKGRSAKNAPRFVMSTDGDEFLAVDLKNDETPSFDKLAELPVNYDFLLPMFGVERFKPAPETAADVKAARHMAKFHDAIRDANPTWGADKVHDLNLFMTRLLFCMFAEDTGIFTDKLFLNTLRREAMKVDGSDTKRVIEDVFLALDLADKDARADQGVRSQRIAADFPYVNGGLFRDHTEIPEFNRKARRLLLEAAELHWDQIHADIFGSMIQAIVQTDMRADFGMHYTSVPNIMKVLEPLFLGSLREQLTAAGDNVKALEKLVERISRIRVFDPACGSGNFLIIAYRELRLIETEAFRRMRDVKRKGQLQLADYQTGIKISNFYGIDPVDFACETAKLSLWISQYQMNRKLDEICSAPTPALPLTDAGSIVVGNALRVDWSEVCPREKEAEIYVVGNPPYLGSSMQTPEQKSDLRAVFTPYKVNYKNLDYVAGWFLKAAEYGERSGAESAFVATNSIAQGEQVALLWPAVFDHGSQVLFAHEAFKWRNNAAKNAAVICVIVAISPRSNINRRVISHDSSRQVRNIGPYLIEMDTVWVGRSSLNLSGLPRMEKGNMASDGGGLILTPDEAREMRDRNPDSSKFIKRYYGSKDYLQSKERYCLWIEDADFDEALSIPLIAERVAASRAFRLQAKAPTTRAKADTAHRFIQIQDYGKPAIIVPRVSSENRLYLPCGFLSETVIINDAALAIYDPPTWLLSVLSTRIHAVWLATVGGRLKSDYRYSNTLVYNNFPMPSLSHEQKVNLEEHALGIVRTREPYVADGKTLGWLYNPKTMPDDLLQAHRNLDDYLETIYIGRQFKDDTERLEHLFKLYARMTKKAAKAA